ncbi:MAG: phosphate ABC transporter permease subunit PstC [candidate division WOR-3 bacterium]|nr:phosphate ABC transporter permease subunit PstC [candidate division WOR-3 bacterium]MCX7948359.1 phosphate ABC transporter permease subunit PstC [candidate division WOR-3 bacterium]MDW8151260.1 phosphate ABC transporter permease subunit PstC [candidate division WOR-3 bacterium]
MRDSVLDILFKLISLFCALLLAVVFISIFVVLYYEAELSISTFGIAFMFKPIWDPVREIFGGLIPIVGTILSSMIAIILATPVSIGIAIFITEICPVYLRNIIRTTIELLSAIPSIIYGIWGLFVLVPFMKNYVEPFLIKYFGFMKIFQGEPFGIGLLSAGIVLAIMIIPIISSILIEVFYLVPNVFKESAYALGATRFEVISKVVISYTKVGILGGIILGLTRALGETMAVTFVIGNSYKIPSNIYDPTITIASALANEFTEATTDLYLSSLFYLSLLLFLISFIIISISRFIIHRIRVPI